MLSRKFWLIALAIITIIIWLVALILLFGRLRTNSVAQVQELPTLVVFPSLTPTQTATAIATATHTSLPTQTAMSSNTPLPTATVTATLSVRLLEVTAIMPNVYIEPTGTPFRFGTNLLPAPPNPIEPLPDATDTVPPFMGWYSFESDYPSIQYSPVRWTARQIMQASEGQYHRYQGVGSATFSFEGEGLRIRYVAARNMGIFEIVVDGQVIDTIDAYNSELIFPGTRVYFVGSGQHRLDIRATGQRNSQSEGITVGLDAIQVYRAEDNTLIIPPAVETLTPIATPQPARSIELIQAPPTLMPTATALAPAEMIVSVVIAYDENGNREVDPAEGVAGIPVRAVEANSNQVIAQNVTDARGYAQLLVIASSEVRVVVPYFGEVWTIPISSNTGNVNFTLLLEPGNQPGIIP